jgi:uncharacterized protein YdhG (YjbR/CyaY superfamily)
MAITTIDEYLAQYSPHVQAECEVLRKLIHTTVPGLEECISYAMPAFRHKGKALVGFAAWTKHIGFYPWSGGIVPQFAEQLRGYKTTTGAIQLPLGQPLDVDLLKQIILRRLHEGELKIAQKPKAKKSNQ